MEGLDCPQLLERCQRRDAAAFDELVRLTEPRLRRLLARLARRAADVDDMLQEAYLRAWRGLPDFRGDAKLSTWLIRIAVNVAHNWRRRMPGIRLTTERASELPAAPMLPGDALQATFRKALEGLPKDLRTVFVLHEVESLSYQEVANVVGCPIGTVMSRLHRARRRLLSTLSDRLEELAP